MAKKTNKLIITEVIQKNIKYGREGYLTIINNDVIFDASDEEYGPIKFDLSILKQAINDHEEKIKTNTQVQ